MSKFVGLMVILVCVFGGYAWAGGNLLALWQPAEILIILGAGIGSLLIANPALCWWSCGSSCARSPDRILLSRNSTLSYLA